MGVEKHCDRQTELSVCKEFRGEQAGQRDCIQYYGDNHAERTKAIPFSTYVMKKLKALLAIPKKKTLLELLPWFGSQPADCYSKLKSKK